MAQQAFLNDLVDQLGKLLPTKAMGGDLQRGVNAVVQSAFSRLDVVTREEFDAQQAVLARTRAKLEALEQQLAAMEADSKDT